MFRLLKQWRTVGKVYFEKEDRKELLTKIIDQVKPEDLKAAGITLTKEQKKNMKENKKQRR